MKRRRPRIRTVLLTVNLLILLLPVAGVLALRIYENELIRSTEAQLLVQGAIVREAFRLEYLRLEGETDEAPEELAGLESGEADPLLPELDISSEELRPRAQDATTPSSPADPIAVRAGSQIDRVLRAAATNTLTGIRVVDSGGTVVASTRTELGLSIAEREEVERSLQGERVSLLRARRSNPYAPPIQSISRGQRYRVFVALPVLDGDRVLGAVVLSRTPLDIVKALYLHRKALFIGAGVILAVVVLVSTLTAFMIGRPVHALIDRAEKIARGDKPGPSRALGTYETARLSEALDHMASTLEHRADYIRAFAAHVSHEFKTPLTTIQGTVELLSDHLDEMSEEERGRFLRNLADSSARLERLVRRMLDLARADALRPGDERTRVASAVAAAVERARKSGLRIDSEIGPGVGNVRMARETLEEVLGILLDNSVQHGGRSVRVRVSSNADPAASRRGVSLVVEDDGPGISEPNATRIFAPFFTTARERGGSGLGLSIARSLLEAHGGSIELERSPRGTKFALWLPAA
jgi:signal transduction histidine kinase